jgi:hypothetical protein
MSPDFIPTVVMNEDCFLLEKHCPIRIQLPRLMSTGFSDRIGLRMVKLLPTRNLFGASDYHFIDEMMFEIVNTYQSWHHQTFCYSVISRACSNDNILRLPITFVPRLWT